MPQSFSSETAARYIFDAHAARAPYQNLRPAVAPATVEEAYAVQEALAELLIPREGPVAGLKIAVATKVMQELMGIDHPCGGMIFARRIHASPATLRLADYLHVVVEFELAVRLGRDLPKLSKPWTADSVKPAIEAVMPAYELIEDRHAVYRETNALSMIADNCWNAGIVLGQPVAYDQRSLAGIAGRLTTNGRETHRGTTDDPLATLAWVANLAADRGRPMTAGMVVITGSVIPTLPIASGDKFVFDLEGVGSVEIAAV
jgi:2-oxo-3-hexenedioate decarboxylase/2-keto-4-pentenoate hydratase